MSFLSWISLIRYVMDWMKRVASDSAINSLSAVDRAMIVWSFDDQNRGESARNTMYPDRDRAVSGSSFAYFGSHVPEKSAST